VKNGHRQSLTQIVITGITGFEGGAKKAAKKETVKGEVLSDHATVNFGEDHELNYHLKKNNLSQSKENRETLITLGKAVKVELEKNILTHEEVDAAIIKNIDQFKALNK
jgi:large subunit ribosomal protein L21